MKETTEKPASPPGQVQPVVLHEAMCCSTCKHLIKLDISVMCYHVTASCAKGVWGVEEFFGDGDYADQITDRQMCDLYESRNAPAHLPGKIKPKYSGF